MTIFGNKRPCIYVGSAGPAKGAAGGDISLGYWAKPLLIILKERLLEFTFNS